MQEKLVSAKNEANRRAESKLKKNLQGEIASPVSTIEHIERSNGPMEKQDLE